MPRYNPPPNWPPPPAGWTPPAGWQPDPSWGPPPAGWQVWVAGAGEAPLAPAAPLATASAAPRRNWLARHKVITALCALIILVAAAGAAGAAAGAGKKDSGTKATVVSAATPTVASPRPSDSSTSPSPITPDPKGTYQHSCDYLLNWHGLNPDYHFIGQAEIHNTGNVGIKVSVKASWKQVGAKAVSVTKVVKVATGKHATVNFKVRASQSQIDQIQAYTGDTNCSVRVTILDSFGQAS